MRHGLVRRSFIPPKDVRQWRELSRLRQKNRDTLGDYKRRVHKLFELANIKIGSVMSDLFDVTGCNLIALLMDCPWDITEQDIRECVRGSLQDKVKELYRSIQGFFEKHHCFELTSLMRIISTIEEENRGIDARMRELLSEHQELIERMDEVPGINELSAHYILSELGPKLYSFATA